MHFFFSSLIITPHFYLNVSILFRRRKSNDLNRRISAHREEFIRYHKNKRTDVKRLSTKIKERHETLVYKKEKEETREEYSRLKALRENDMESYTKLVQETKNERLRYVM